MLRLIRAVVVIVGVMAAAAGLAMAAGHVGLTSDDGLRIVFLSSLQWSTEIWLTKPDGTSLNVIRRKTNPCPSCGGFAHSGGAAKCS
jgi:hypothetical protein